jgi:hypothetical protein
MNHYLYPQGKHESLPLPLWKLPFTEHCYLLPLPLPFTLLVKVRLPCPAEAYLDSRKQQMTATQPEFSNELVSVYVCCIIRSWWCTWYSEYSMYYARTTMIWFYNRRRTSTNTTSTWQGFPSWFATPLVHIHPLTPHTLTLYRGFHVPRLDAPTLVCICFLRPGSSTCTRNTVPGTRTFLYVVQYYSRSYRSQVVVLPVQHCTRYNSYYNCTQVPGTALKKAKQNKQPVMSIYIYIYEQTQSCSRVWIRCYHG